MRILETERLILRTFGEDDLGAMTAIDQDPRVCEYLPEIGTRKATLARMKRIKKHQEEKGFTLYAVVLKATGELIGFLGLMTPSFDAHFTPAVEIGWRLSATHWNKGYATEGATAMLHYAFTELNLAELVSFTAMNNQASKRVMEKIGLRHNPLDDFDHPLLAKHNPLQRHVLYRLSQADYLANKNPKIINSFADKIKQAYDHVAAIWHDQRDWYIEQPAIDALIKLLHPGAAILDVGCGSGKPIAAYLKSNGFNVYGIDISAQQIEYAKEIIPEQNLFVTDVCDFNPSMQFDAIVCWFTLFHIHANQHEAVLKKMHGLLKPEGLLLITFADTSQPPQSDWVIIDESTIESEMFGAHFYHSGQPSQINSQRVSNAGFIILSDQLDQPGNQVILAKRGSMQ